MDGPNVALWQRCHERKNRDKGRTEIILLSDTLPMRIPAFHRGAYCLLLTVPQLPHARTCRTPRLLCASEYLGAAWMAAVSSASASRARPWEV